MAPACGCGSACCRDAATLFVNDEEHSIHAHPRNEGAANVAVRHCRGETDSLVAVAATPVKPTCFGERETRGD